MPDQHPDRKQQQPGKDAAVEQPALLRVEPLDEQHRQQTGENDTEQREGFAKGDYARALVGVVARACAPRQIGDIERTVRGVDQYQRCREPELQLLPLQQRRIEQRGVGDAEREGCEHSQQRPAAGPALHVIGKPAKPGILHCVQQARAEQDDARQGQAQAQLVAIKFGGVDIDRQCRHCQRGAEQAICQSVADGHWR